MSYYHTRFLDYLHAGILFFPASSMNTILIPVDYSLASFNAFHYALEIAGQFSSRVILYHASKTTGAGVGMMNNPKFKPNVGAQQYLEELEYSVPPHIARHIELELHTDDNTPVDGILNMCKRFKPSLMVMGMKNRGMIEGMLIGSTVSRMLSKYICPVMVVPERRQYRPIRNIAYGTTFDKKEHTTIDRLLEFAFLNEALIHCVHIETKHDQQSQTVKKKQRVLKDHYRDDIILNQIRVETFSHTSAMEGLVDYAGVYEVDVLAIQTRHRGFWAELFNPGLCKRLVFHTEIPLLIF